MTGTDQVNIDVSLVRKLIATQFPDWAGLEIRPVEHGGWDNRSFHLGDHMLLRLPSAQCYVEQVEKEQYWLPKLAPYLPLLIPVPLAIGKPGEGYPWYWSVNQWINGNTATIESIENMTEFATSLAAFLTALHKVDTTGGPTAGEHNFHRGGRLATYDSETHQATAILGKRIDVHAVKKVWKEALSTTWQLPPVWVHGDVAAGNLLVEKGKLSAVIDFGQLGIGDPACDLVIAWTMFKGESRKAFQAALLLDRATWARARGWALWKALIVCAELAGTNPQNIEISWKVMNEVLADYAKDNQI